MDPKGAGSELQESRGAAPLLGWSIFVRLLFVLGLTGAALAPARRGAAAPPSARPVSFARDVAPIFNRWCVSCHGSREAQNALRLDSLEGVMRGSDAGPVVIAGNPDDSLLAAKIERRHRPSMPPRRRMPAPAIALIRAWIAGGAPR
jgi:mono/diheme cytochrome c family protein